MYGTAADGICTGGDGMDRYADGGIYVNTSLVFPSGGFSNVSIQGNAVLEAAGL